MLSMLLVALLAGTDTQVGSTTPSMCARPHPIAGQQLPSIIATTQFVRAWLDAIESADDPTFMRFVRERGPVLRAGPERWLDLRDMMRGLQLCGLKSATAEAVDFWVFDPNYDSFAVAQFTLPASPSGKVFFQGVWDNGEAPPGFTGPAKLALPDLIAAVEARLAAYTAKDRFSGAVLIARNGQVLFQQARGFADREAHIPNDLNTQFRFGSVGKMFTITAIMQLAQDGKVDLSAPIGRYLTDYPNADVATKVSVANLLTHTGGTGDIFGPDFDAHKAELRHLKDYVALYGKRPLEFSPGSRFSYSNYGFILLGRIVEQVSNLSYDAYLQRNIFDVAGMTSTGNLPEAAGLSHRAVAYMGFGAGLKRADVTLPVRGTSAGGGYATVGDMNRFLQAVATHRLLRAETLRQLMEGGVKGPDGKFFRYDFGGKVEGAGTFIGHDGGAPGISGSVARMLESGYTVIVLANRDPGTAESIAKFALHRLPAN
jgi:D-alanyl-D-alanine carboxypeptidase